MLREPIISSRDKLLIAILIALIFAGMSFCYSFIGFFSPQTKNVGRLDVFGSLTLQEFGGHFVFGFVAGLVLRKLMMAVLCGLMAIAVDADHILSAAGFEIQGRMSHSIPFIIIASVLVGMITTLILKYLIRDNAKHVTTRANWTNREANSVNDWGSHLSSDILVWNTFSRFLIITAAAVISHIAYDTFVDTHANFPLLVPFVYTDFYIPQIYWLPIEAAAILLVCLRYRTVQGNMHASRISVF